MFLRLFFAFLGFGILTSTIVGAMLLHRVNGGWFPAMLTQALPIVSLVILVAVAVITLAMVLMEGMMMVKLQMHHRIIPPPV